MVGTQISRKLTKSTHCISNVWAGPKHGIHDATNVGLVVTGIDLWIVKEREFGMGRNGSRSRT